MALHLELGKKGEQMAEQYLIQKGFTVLHRNWRHAKYEVDLIALKGPVLHFIEVKLRSSKDFGPPEKKVTKKKFRNLLMAADEFLFQHLQYRHVQFDILAINLQKDGEPNLLFIEDVYL
jgi:putative endonuclease